MCEWRVGDLVQLIVDRINKWPEPEEKVLGPDVGTIIRIEMDEDFDGRSTKSITTRWNNGKVETYTKETEPDIYDLEVVTPLLYVNIYLHDRVCGGPEEGGDWYDVYDAVPEECLLCATPEDAETMLERKKEWCAEQNAERYPPSSVLSEGHYVAWLEAWPAQSQPTEAYHYS